MGDMGDTFNAMKEASQEKRAMNRSYSPAMLRDFGIAFESKNGGAHLVVNGRIDFWPGTGLWIDRGTGAKRRGVRNLIAHINGMKP